MKTELINLSYQTIGLCGGYGSVPAESRESILNYLGMFGAETDNLINKFYEINSIVDNGGAPILKQLIKLLDNDTEYKIEIAKSTACLMLKDQHNNLLDYEFINKFYFESIMTQDELNNHIADFATKNNITEYALGGLV